MPTPDPKARFSDRVDNYVRYRPSYPASAVDWLLQRAGLGPGTRVADVGSGTGILTALLLERGLVVDAVEPNDAMRAAAEARLADRPGFHSINASAESTALADRSVALVVAAQAFHWFDPPRFAEEARRVLTPGGKVALVWNTRRTAGSPFAERYEALLQTHGTDYRAVHHHQLGDREFDAFFTRGHERASFPYAQHFGYHALEGRLLSSSYAPPPGHPDHLPMLAALRELFEDTAEDGRVAFAYDTQVYVGQI